MLTFPHGFLKGAVAAAGGSDLYDSVVSYWSLDETTGIRADSHGNNDLTDTNTVGNATGVVSNAADYIATNSEYLVKASPTGLNGGDRDWWISTWIYVDIIATKAWLKLGALNSNVNSDLDYFIYLAGTSFYLFASDGSNAQNIQASSLGAISAGTWYQIVAWHDSAANTLNIEGNNGTVDTNSSFPTLSHQTNATTFQLGGGYGAAYVDGRQDETMFGAGSVPSGGDRTWLYNNAAGRSYADLQAYEPSSLMTDLVSWWSLDEESGTRYDEHGQNNLTDTNTVLYADGKHRNAADFVAANNEYLVKTVHTGSGLDGGDRDFTIAGWIYYDTLGAAAIIKCGALNNNAAANQDWMFYVLATGEVYFYGFASGTFQYIEASSFGALSTGTWYHFVGWHDATEGSVNVQINNGTVDTNSTITTLTHSVSATSVQLGGGYSTDYIDGRLDETAFWSRVLTTAERTELYNSGNGIQYPGINPLLQNLVSWWNLDETSGTRLDSHSGNDLTDTNTVLSATGIVSNAADFVEANSEYLVRTVATADGLDGGDRDFTIAGWVRFDNTFGGAFIKLGALNSSTASDTDWLAYVSASQFAIFGIATSSFQSVTATTFGSISTSIWYHYVAWQDATANTLNIQINNGTVDTNSSYTTLTHQTNAVSLQLGGGFGTTYMDGRLDEVGFWDRVLTADERALLYNNGNGIGYPT